MPLFRRKATQSQSGVSSDEYGKQYNSRPLATPEEFSPLLNEAFDRLDDVNPLGLFLINSGVSRDPIAAWTQWEAEVKRFETEWYALMDAENRLGTVRMPEDRECLIGVQVYAEYYFRTLVHQFKADGDHFAAFIFGKSRQEADLQKELLQWQAKAQTMKEKLKAQVQRLHGEEPQEYRRLALSASTLISLGLGELADES